MVRLAFADEAPPKWLGHLVSGIAAETFKTKSEQMFDDSETIAIQPFGITGVAVIELGEVFPDHSFTIVLAIGIGDPPVRITDEPLRVLPGQRRVDGAMIDDKD